VIAGVAIFVAGLIPTLGLATFDFQAYSTVADRYAYIAMLGAALIAAGTVARFGVRAIAAWGVVLVILAGLSWKQVWVWRDTRTVAAHTLAVNPGSWVAHKIVGYALMREHRGVEAV